MADREQLTDEEKEVAFVAWALKARDKAFVPTDEFLPAAESMETKGWLSSTTLKNGDVAYAFTAAGETALDMSELVRERNAAVN
jgi:hypothetical protein